MKFKNIIFDLGNVVLNVDTSLTESAFAHFSGLKIAEIKEIFKKNGEFMQYETGHLNDDSFRKFVRKVLNKPGLSNDTIDAAWNSMLVDFPPRRIKILQEIKTKYRTFLLSNTSAIHLEKINEILRLQFGINQIDELFEKTYYSFKVGSRKPDREVFEKVLADAAITAEETLFLDDNTANIVAASSLGIASWLVVPGKNSMEEIINSIESRA